MGTKPRISASSRATASSRFPELLTSFILSLIDILTSSTSGITEYYSDPHTMSSITSIPTSPPPGKDPPTPSSTTRTKPPSSPSDPSPSSALSPHQPCTTSLTSPTQPTSSQTQNPTSANASMNRTASGSSQQARAPPTPNLGTNANPNASTTTIPKRNFAPFFTLIADAGTESTYHPSRTHYIFSDDDSSDVLQNACLRVLSTPSISSAGASQRLSSSSSSNSNSNSTSNGNANAKSSPRGKEPERRREERVIIVDVNEAGDGVEKVTGLNSTWQVLSAEIGKAPTWDGADESAVRGGEGEEGRGLMLKIEGVGGRELFADTGSGSGDLGREVGEEEMMVLIEGFDRKMAVLRKITEKGGLEVEDLGAGEGEGKRGEEQEECAVEE
ncbi:hypothetical protein B7494_g4005 [Chlorociboria aeruginascens]|nr:hypothetical protein B7494_g4005 [Chlorociboria aeruginascens]